MILAAAPASGGVQSAARTILVVDHRETIRRVLALILESEGFQVVSTDTASAAVALAFEIQPAVVMLDLALAQQSAIKALKSLKVDARTRDVPVILLTTPFDVVSDVDRAQAAAVLTKPLDLDAMVTVVRGLVMLTV
jgi:DNA-binding response OmpR family regulator